MLRVAHFRDQDEEHEVPGVGEDGVRDADEGGDEVCACGDGGISSRGWVEACTHHADYAGDDDGDDAGDGEPGETVESAR